MDNKNTGKDYLEKLDKIIKRRKAQNDALLSLFDKMSLNKDDEGVSDREGR